MIKSSAAGFAAASAFVLGGGGHYLLALGPGGSTRPPPAAIADGVAGGVAPGGCDSGEITTLTYNVFLGSGLLESFTTRSFHGLRPWSERRGEIRALIGEYAPDVFGLQEVGSDADALDLVDAAGPYRVVSYHLGAVGYDDAAILFRADRFSLLDSGQFWLAPRPGLILALGYKPWTLPRMVNWALLRQRDTGFTFLFVNTHFDDHKLNAAASSVELHDVLAGIQWPVIVTGDFNTDATTERYRILTGADGSSPLLRDTFADARQRNVIESGSGIRPIGYRDAVYRPQDGIDHIFTGGGCRARVEQWIVDARTGRGGQRLSDHAPVIARLSFSAPGADPAPAGPSSRPAVPLLGLRGTPPRHSG